jgi:tetratricopeptide (TPR) repeat protein
MPPPRPPLALAGLALALALAGGCGRPEEARRGEVGNGPGAEAPPLRLADLEGRMVEPLERSAARATVFLLVGTECPISNRYAPEILRLHRAFAPRGVAFRLVYPDAEAPAEAIRRHREEYGFPFEALRDPRHELVTHAAAAVTPEAAVFDAGGELVYSGRIDDRWVAFGRARAQPTVRDLEDALEAVLAGRPVSPARVPAIGCTIPGRRIPARPTFAADVAPIVFARCSPCHNPAGPGPFALLSYDDVADRARQIAEVTRTGFMPPWLPEPGSGDFLGERRLEPEEVEVIQRWTAAGAPEGDPAVQPRPPEWRSGWPLGEPDLVAAMPEEYRLPAEGRDVFRNFVVAIPASSTRWVRAIDLRPSDPKLIHHATMWIDRTATSRRIDTETAEPGYPSMDPRTAAEDPDGQFLGWTPGTVPFAGRPGIAWRLDPGTDLVLQLHMLPSGKPETLRCEVGFYFVDQPPERLPFILRLGSKTLDIPPGADDYTVEDSYRLPVDVEALAVRPHAHYLGRRMEVWATPPGGERRWLLRMDWDFNWQEEYHYREPVPLPAGTTVAMRYVYDNSADNPLNPHHPPRRVRYGPSSSDEMGDLWLQVLPAGPEQRRALAEDFAATEREALIAGYRFALEHTDDPAPVHVDLALTLTAAGRYPEAMRHYDRALAVRPGYATALNNSGTLLGRMGDLDAAAVRYRRALEADPGFYEAHYNLGAVLLAGGDLDGAVEHLRRGLELNPGNAGAQTDLGTALFRRGELRAAGERFAEALRLRPDDLRARYNLGLTRANLGDLAAAAESFRGVLALDPGFVEAHVSLGHVALRTGAPGEAAGHFRRALALAPGHEEARRGLEQASGGGRLGPQ